MRRKGSLSQPSPPSNLILHPMDNSDINLDIFLVYLKSSLKELMKPIVSSLSLSRPPFLSFFSLQRAHTAHLLMDINNIASTSSSWDFDMEQLFLEETPLQFLYPVDPSQPHIPPTSFPNAQVGIQREVEGDDEDEEETLGAMKEMLYRIAAMQPVDIDPSTIKKPKRRNVRISDDPQSIVARHRRERISERIRILQRMVPGGTKMDTASMLDEAIRYVKFLKRQVQELQSNQQQHIAVVGGQPATMFMDWLALQPDPIGSSSSSSSAIGSPPGLGFGFTGNRTSDLMF